MTMTIGGIDLAFSTPRANFDRRLILGELLRFWPNAVVEDALQGRGRSLHQEFRAPTMEMTNEFFVYKDPENEQSWSANGPIASNENGMIHVLIDEQGNGVVQTTLVVDHLVDEMLEICGSIRRALSPPSVERNGHRTNIQCELRTAGSPMSRQEFLNLLAEVRESAYPTWTADELVCHPSDAERFCALVRSRSRALLPDALILKGLLAARKRRAS